MSWFMPEVGLMDDGQADDDDDLSDDEEVDDYDDGIGISILSCMFQLAGPSSSPVQRLNC